MHAQSLTIRHRRQVQHMTAYSYKATFINESKATRFFHCENPVSGSWFFYLRFPDYNHTTSAIWLTVAENGGARQVKLPHQHRCPTSCRTCHCWLFASFLPPLSNNMPNCTSYPATATNKLSLKDCMLTSTQTSHPAMSPARVTTKVRAARMSVPTKMMAPHN